jgi:hypothetical protein
MSRKRKSGSAKDSEGLWIAPRYSMKGPAGDRAWENRTGGPPSNNKFLELADIALGVKKPEPQKKRLVVHDKSKSEPYSQK